MTTFELVFWPLWLFGVWLCQDERLMRLQCWWADWMYETIQAATTGSGKVQ